MRSKKTFLSAFILFFSIGGLASNESEQKRNLERKNISNVESDKNLELQREKILPYYPDKHGQVKRENLPYYPDKHGQVQRENLIMILPSPRVVSLHERTPQVRLSILRALNLGKSQMDQVTEKKLASIKDLHIGDRGIISLKEGDFFGLTSLERLDLSMNHLRYLPEDLFKNLTSLREINLNRNQLESLPKGIFAGLSSLEQLYISYNNISSLPEDLFKDLSSLKHLGLSNNNLEPFSSHEFSGLSALESIDISGNNLAFKYTQKETRTPCHLTFL